jgi:hypothetical protein
MEAKEDSMKKKIAWLMLVIFAFALFVGTTVTVVHADPGDVETIVPPTP